MTLATALVTARADADGSRYFRDLSERNPDDATAQALAGFFQVRAGRDVASAIVRLDKAATMDLGLPQKQRRRSTCWPGGKRAPSSPPLSTLPTRATWPSR